MHIMFQASEIHVRWGNVISLQPPVFVHTHACANMCVLAAFLSFRLKVICVSESMYFLITLQIQEYVNIKKKKKQSFLCKWKPKRLF